MKFYVPTIGSKFSLTAGWEFVLYKEYRNRSLFEAFGPHAGKLVPIQVYTPGYRGFEKETAYKFALPPGTVLGVDRIYIRRNQQNFDSITLRIFETTHPFILHAATVGKKGKSKVSKSKVLG